MILTDEEISVYEKFNTIFARFLHHPDCILHVTPYTNQLKQLSDIVANWIYKEYKDDVNLSAFRKACDEILNLPPFSNRKPKKLFQTQDVFSATCDELISNLRDMRDLSIKRAIGKNSIQNYINVSLIWWGIQLSIQLIVYLISYILMGSIIFASLLFPLPLAPLIIPSILISLLFTCASQIYGGRLYSLLKDVIFKRDNNILESNREFTMSIPLTLLGTSFLASCLMGGIACVLLFGPATPIIMIVTFAISTGLTAIVSILKDISIGVILAALIDAISTIIDKIEESIQSFSKAPVEKEQNSNIDPVVSSLSFLNNQDAEASNQTNIEAYEIALIRR